jgi:hypothetical protein
MGYDSPRYRVLAACMSYRRVYSGKERSLPKPSHMYLLKVLGLALLAAALASAQSPSPNPNQDIITTLKTTASQVERVNILDANEFIFDFGGTVGVSEGRGGKVVSASSRNFPALIGNGVAMTVGYLGPCGINLPHTHPRATEINYVASVWPSCSCSG